MCLQIPRNTRQACHTDPRGEAQELSGDRRNKGKMWARDFIMVTAERNGEAGYTGLGPAGLNTFSGLWGIGAVPGCLVLGPGLTRVGR